MSEVENKKCLTPVIPTRRCKRCLNHYHYDGFRKTSKGQLRYVCIDCEDERKEEQKQEQMNMQRIRRDADRQHKVKVIGYLMTNDPNVNFNKAKSMTLHFD